MQLKAVKAYILAKFWSRALLMVRSKIKCFGSNQ